MTDDSRSATELFLSDLQDIEDHLSELAMTADAILPDLERRLAGSAQRPGGLGRDKELIYARELLTAIARNAEHLASVVDDLVAVPPGSPPVPADDQLVVRLDGLATRAEPSPPDLGL